MRSDDRQIYEKLQRSYLCSSTGVDYLLSWGAGVLHHDYKDRKAVLRLCDEVKRECVNHVADESCKNPELYNALYWRIMLFEAQNRQFDSYLMYVEKDRPYEERFYQPRRKCFRRIGLIQAIQDMIDDELDGLCISLPPGTGKTTLSKFLISAVIGWWPKEYNLFFSHSADITRMYYDGALDIVTSPEYNWASVFPDLKVSQQNAKMQQFNVGKYKPFPSLNTASVGSEMAGKVRASKFLMVDDMIGKIEEALNKNTLDKLWNIYASDALQRMVDGCKQIHIATRWSVHDVIGRLQSIHEGNKRWRFIAVPDIDPKTGESNFLFDVNGFSTDFYNNQALVMDDITYQCLYKNQPVEREGLLYHESDLRRYLSRPMGEPDAVWGICDTKASGVDFMVLPVMYQYGDDYYMVDTICDDSSDFNLQYSRIANLIFMHNVQQCEFESNAGGDRIAWEVKQRLDAVGCRCNVTTKPTETNKETRIIVNSDWIKKHVLFKDKSLYSPKDDYGRFMGMLVTYSVSGKNKHDDVPDCLANFALFITRKLNYRPTVIIQSPFGGI